MPVPVADWTPFVALTITVWSVVTKAPVGPSASTQFSELPVVKLPAASAVALLE
jgi:hypothetical protein